METETSENGSEAVRARSVSFERFAGVCAVLAGFLYAVAFVVLQDELLSGLLTGVALVAVYERLRETDASFALLALGTVSTPGNWPEWRLSSSGVSGATDHSRMLEEEAA